MTDCPHCRHYQKSETPGVVEAMLTLADHQAPGDLVLRVFRHIPWVRQMQDEGWMRKPTGV